MSACNATTKAGTPCELQATTPEGFCWSHDPRNRAKRSRSARRAAKSKATPDREIAEIKNAAKTLAAGVIGGRIDRRDATAAAQCFRVALAAISIGLDVRDQMEFAERLESIEAALAARKGGRYYGA